MSYWIFKANPELYDIDSRLKDKTPETTWRVSRYKDEIKPGDIAFIWRCGKDRGICGYIKVTSYPNMMVEIRNELRYYIIKQPHPPVMESGPELMVDGVFQCRGPFIHHSVLRKTPGLGNLCVFHGFQAATNFKVTQAEGRIIMRFFQ
jgi:hypothetical protein